MAPCQIQNIYHHDHCKIYLTKIIDSLYTYYVYTQVAFDLEPYQALKINGTLKNDIHNEM